MVLGSCIWVHVHIIKMAVLINRCAEEKEDDLFCATGSKFMSSSSSFGLFCKVCVYMSVHEVCVSTWMCVAATDKLFLPFLPFQLLTYSALCLPCVAPECLRNGYDFVFHTIEYALILGVFSMSFFSCLSLWLKGTLFNRPVPITASTNEKCHFLVPLTVPLQSYISKTDQC